MKIAALLFALLVVAAPPALAQQMALGCYDNAGHSQGILGPNQGLGTGHKLWSCPYDAYGTAQWRTSWYINVTDEGNIVICDNDPSDCAVDAIGCPPSPKWSVNGGPGAFIYVFPSGTAGLYGPSWQTYWEIYGAPGSVLSIANGGWHFAFIGPDLTSVEWSIGS